MWSSEDGIVLHRIPAGRTNIVLLFPSDNNDCVSTDLAVMWSVPFPDLYARFALVCFFCGRIVPEKNELVFACSLGSTVIFLFALGIGSYASWDRLLWLRVGVLAYCSNKVQQCDIALSCLKERCSRLVGAVREVRGGWGHGVTPSPATTSPASPVPCVLSN